MLQDNTRISVVERPIIFSAPMVRALLDGSKTQTRRALRNQVTAPATMQMAKPGYAEIINEHGVQILGWSCPYGRPGDRLWVRETFLDTLDTGVEHRDESGLRHRYAFAADCAPGSYGDQARKEYGLKWKPSIHMPRAASRILLEIVSVRVEQLQDISGADAKAEGVEPHEVRQFAVYGATPAERASIYRDAAVGPYQRLWQRINGSGSWGANPWVWVLEFKRVHL